jgi:hypothetical protein
MEGDQEYRSTMAKEGYWDVGCGNRARSPKSKMVERGMLGYVL